MIIDLLYGGGSFGEIMLTFLCVLAAIVLSLSLHEFAHAFVAHKCGDDTAKNNGRMTLNPLKHIDPLGFILLILLGFGFAKAVPINPYNFKKMRRDYFFVSVAGITVNLILAFISSFFYVLFLRMGNWIAVNFFFYFMTINIGLMIFNLIPIFPLDGFRIVEAAAGRTNRFVNFMRRNGQRILFGLLIWSVVLGWIIQYVPEEAGNILQYFDILGFTLRFLINGVMYGFTWLWGLTFF